MKMFLGSVDAVGNSYVLTAQQEVENAFRMKFPEKSSFEK